MTQNIDNINFVCDNQPVIAWGVPNKLGSKPSH